MPENPDNLATPNISGDEERVTETINLDTLCISPGEAVDNEDFTKISESAFAKLLETISVPSLLIERSHTIRYANRACRELLDRDVPLDRVTYDSLFCRPDQAKRATAHLERTFQEGKALVRERIIQFHVKTVWVRFHYRTLRMRGEHFVLVQIENLTAHKQLLAIQKYKKLVNIFPFGILELAFKKPVPLSWSVEKLLEAVFDARVAEGNQQFILMHRRESLSDLVGARFGTLFSKVPRFQSICEEWVRSGFSARSFETQDEFSPGGLRHFEHTLLGNVSEHYLLGFWWLKRDISEKKRQEEEIMRIQKLESLGILAGGIAHDFNNLLTGILGNISLAQKYLSGSGPAVQRLEAAGKAANRAQELTSQLLTFSRGGAPVRRTGSIVELLRESVTFALRGSNVRCQFILSKNLWPVDIDEAQISSVIHNLVINAVQAMPKGGTIQVQASKYVLKGNHSLPLKNGNYVRIAIRDSGCGIPTQNLQKIFDPYFTTKETGSGLGLATSYAVIRKHDGLITVKSKEGVGSNFYVYLPASTNVPTPSEAKTEKLVSGHGRILIMDDEEVIRELAGELLESLGYEVKLAWDGSQAVLLYQEAMAAGKPFHVVIMDLTVPGGMGGKETIKKLRELDPSVKAIVSSGYSNDPIMADFERYGFLGVLPKPYTVGTLSELLKKLIDA